MTVFFYDSYAVIEYLRDNPTFRPYFEDHTGVLTFLNILEIYYSVLNEAGKDRADIVLEMLFQLRIEPTKEIIKKVMTFRMENKKQDLSYADCLGYIIAQEQKILFLTGDSKFRDVKGVAFVR